MNLIVTLRVFSTVFLGVLAAFAAPNPQSDGCVPFPCGPFTCPPADQNDQALISSSANSTTLTCVYQRLEVPCVYMQSDVSVNRMMLFSVIFIPIYYRDVSSHLSGAASYKL